MLPIIHSGHPSRLALIVLAPLLVAARCQEPPPGWEERREAAELARWCASTPAAMWEQEWADVCGE